MDKEGFVTAEKNSEGGAEKRMRLFRARGSKKSASGFAIPGFWLGDRKVGT